MRSVLRFFRRRPAVLVLPKSAGKCPKAYSGRHVTSDDVDHKVCLNCLGALAT